MLTLPMCGWPTSKRPPTNPCDRNIRSGLWATNLGADSRHADSRERGIGTMNRDNVQKLLSSMAIYPFTQFLEYAPMS